MLMPGRHTTSETYRYGYNGMEMDNEQSGNGNSYTTEFRQYDPRLMRWKSLDPLMAQFPWMSPYMAFDNNPIYFIDPYGLESGTGSPDDTGGEGDPPAKGDTRKSAKTGSEHVYDGNNWNLKVEAVSVTAKAQTYDVGVYQMMALTGIAISMREAGFSTELTSMIIKNHMNDPEFTDFGLWQASRLNSDIGKVIKSLSEINQGELGHGLLDLGGTLPFAGELFDGINAVWYYSEGDKTNGSLSLGAMIPFVGWGVTASKYGLKYGGKFVKSADEFYAAAKKLKVGERVLVFKDIAKQVAGNNGWTKSTKLSKVNGRDVYQDIKSGMLFSVDTQHGAFEILNKQEKHLGEMDFTGKLTKGADKSGKHNIKVK